MSSLCAIWAVGLVLGCPLLVVGRGDADLQKAPQVAAHQSALIRNAETHALLAPNSAAADSTAKLSPTGISQMVSGAENHQRPVSTARIVIPAGGVPASMYDFSQETASAQQLVQEPVTHTRGLPKGILPVSSIPGEHTVAHFPAWLLWLSFYTPWGASLLYSLTFAGIVKFFCMAGNVLVQVSPYPLVKRWEKRQCTGEADAAPYIAIAFGGCQWCFYGIFAWIVTKRSGFLILVHSNCLGAFLGSYYTFTFYRNCRNTAALNSLNRYISAATSLALLQVCTILSLPAERALFLTGLVASFCGFVGAMSMLVTVPVVIQTRDSRSICGPLVWSNFLCALVWCLCGWILQDPLVTGPNVVAAMASSVCMCLKWQFPADVNIVDSDDDDVVASARKNRSWRIPTEATPLVVNATQEVSAPALPATEPPASIPPGIAVASPGDLLPSSEDSVLEDDNEEETLCLEDTSTQCADGTGGTY